MTSQPAVEPQPKNALARVIGVFTEPKATFADIGARPTWLVPLVLIIVVQIVFMLLVSQRIGWETIARQQIEKSSQAQTMSAEQMQQAVSMGAKMAGIFAYVGVVVGVPVVITVIAAVLMFTMGMGGGKFNFKQSFGITAHASLIGIIAGVLAMIVMFAKSAEDFNLQNPLAFNLEAFLSAESPKWLSSLGGSLDLFSFWSIAWLALGYSAASLGRLKFSKALMAVVLPWAIWVIGKVGWAALRG